MAGGLGPEEPRVLDRFHPYDQVEACDPHPSLDVARSECPVLRCHRDGYPDVTIVTRAGDLHTAFRDYRVFGNMSTKTTIAAHNAALVNDPGIGDLDPPTHTQIRRLLLVAMAPNALGGAEQRFEAMARRVTASFAHRGEADLLSDWATPLPSDAIASVLSLPESDWPMIHAFVQAQFSDATTACTGDTALTQATASEW